MVSPTLFVVLIMRLMSSLKVFDLIYMMVDSSNPVLNDAQTLMSLFYRESFIAGDKGLRRRHRRLDRPADRSGHSDPVHRPEEVGQLRGVKHEHCNCYRRSRPEHEKLQAGDQSPHLCGPDPWQHHHDLPLCVDGADLLQDPGRVDGIPPQILPQPVEFRQLCHRAGKPALCQPVHQHRAADRAAGAVRRGVQLDGGLRLRQAALPLQEPAVLHHPDTR